MTLDKESRLALRAEARAIYQEFKRLGGDSTEVQSRRAELERRYQEINALIAKERDELTAEAERIPVELAAIIGNDPEEQAERARLMARYEEIHAILKKRPKSFEQGNADAAPDADDDEVADWTATAGASETVIAAPEDLASAGLDSPVESPKVDSGAETVIGSPPDFTPFEEPEDLPAVAEVVETTSDEPAAEPAEERPSDNVPPESDFELPNPAEEAHETPKKEEAIGLAAFSLNDLLDDGEDVGEANAEVAAIDALPDPDELKTDSGASEKGVAWSDFADDDDAKKEDESNEDGWVLPALSEESGGNGKAKDAWDDDEDDEALPPLADFVDDGDHDKEYVEDPLLNVTSIGDGGVERKREDIPLPQDKAEGDNALWQDLSGDQHG